MFSINQRVKAVNVYPHVFGKIMEASTWQQVHGWSWPGTEADKCYLIDCVLWNKPRWVPETGLRETDG